MKSQDFERLKAICEKEGFELVTESPKENDKFYVVRKKDEWEGVEFAEFIHSETIHKVNLEHSIGSIIQCLDGTWGNKCHFNPSTEQAYIEQLKKIACEKFGEIKDGDRFTYPYSKGEQSKCRFTFKDSWKYFKDEDEMFFQCVKLYSKGRWAERVKERVKIEWHTVDDTTISFRYSGDINLIKKMPFLAAQLEKYLNDEI